MKFKQKFITSSLALGLVTSNIFVSNADIKLEQLGTNQETIYKVGIQSDIVPTDIKGHWAEKEIENAIAKGWVDKAEKFRPYDSITRGEFVKIFNRVFELTQTSGVIFNDSVGHWAQKEIDIAVTNGVCGGIGNNMFAPNKNITRQEASKMLANYLKINDTNHDKTKAFPDYSQVDTWAINELEAVVEKGYIQGTGDGKLSPKNNISRAESVKLFNNLVEVKLDAIVNIPDSNLKAGLNKIIDPKRSLDQDIKKIELESIQDAWLTSSNIENLEGIQYMTNLSTLNLSSNNIKSIKQLRNLANLKSLTLSNNEIKDLEYLPKNLINLDLSSNGIEDISKMNVVVDSNLDLSNNKIKDISKLSLGKYTTELDLADNQIEDISSLSQLNSIRFLRLENNQIEDVSPLRKDANLINIYLDRNKILDMSTLPKWASAPTPDEDGGRRSATNQNAILPEKIITGGYFEIENPTFSLFSKNADIIEISDGGRVEGNKIIWENLTESKDLSFKFSKYSDFNGTVTQPIKIIK